MSTDSDACWWRHRQPCVVYVCAAAPEIPSWVRFREAVPGRACKEDEDCFCCMPGGGIKSCDELTEPCPVSRTVCRKKGELGVIQCPAYRPDGGGSGCCSSGYPLDSVHEKRLYAMVRDPVSKELRFAFLHEAPKYYCGYLVLGARVTLPEDK
jgi:hypothetical protein